MKSRSAGSRERREAVGAHAELAEVLGVGAAAHQVRRDDRVRVLGEQAAVHRVDQGAVVRRLPGRLVGEVLDVDALADQLAQGVEELVLVAGQGPPVDVRGGLGRDDVHLVAGGEHGRVDGVADDGAEHPGGAAELVDQGAGVVRA